MLRAILVSSALAVSSITYTVHVENKATGARPSDDLPRAIFCAGLLAHAGWQSRYAPVPLASTRVLSEAQRSHLNDLMTTWGQSSGHAVWPLGRVFIGPAGTLDDETLLRLGTVERLSVQNLELRGDDVMKVIQTLRVRDVEFHRPPETAAPGWMLESQTFKDFQTARYALEIGDLENMLSRYQAGLDTSKIVFTVSRVAGPARWSSFLADNLFQTLGRRADENHFIWHVLYFDTATKTPVWRMGLSRQF